MWMQQKLHTLQMKREDLAKRAELVTPMMERGFSFSVEVTSLLALCLHRSISFCSMSTKGGGYILLKPHSLLFFESLPISLPLLKVFAKSCSCAAYLCFAAMLLLLCNVMVFWEGMWGNPYPPYSIILLSH